VVGGASCVVGGLEQRSLRGPTPWQGGRRRGREAGVPTANRVAIKLCVCSLLHRRGGVEPIKGVLGCERPVSL